MVVIHIVGADEILEAKMADVNELTELFMKSFNIMMEAMYKLKGKQIGNSCQSVIIASILDEVSQQISADKEDMERLEEVKRCFISSAICNLMMKDSRENAGIDGPSKQGS